jgi:hypothetical protein
MTEPATGPDSDLTALSNLAEQEAAEDAAALEVVPDPEPEPASEPDPGALRGLIIRVPNVFGMRAIRQLFVAAFTPQDGQHLPNAIDAIDWCQQFCEGPTTAVIVAVEGLEGTGFEFRGLAICDYSPGVWSYAPQCLHFHSTGRDSVRVLSDAVANWLREIGQHELTGLNFTGASDKAHGRMFAGNFSSEKLASLLLMRLKGDEDELE